jgi:hypothetical protein
MRTICACLLACVAVGGAQAPVPTRPLGPVVATSQPLALVREVRQLADGRVMVNDYGAKQLLLFDSLLKTPTVLLDSAGPADRRRYGRGGFLIPYVADSSIFFDFYASAMLMMDGNGVVARVAAPPATGRGDAGIPPNSKLDAKGRLLFQQSGSFGRGSPPGYPVGSSMNVSYSLIMGYDMPAHRVDTVFIVRLDTTITPPRDPSVPPTRAGPRQLFPAVNENAIMSDGSIAVIRGLDYHVDFVGPDGKVTISPRIAHEWRRLTDADKQRLADSMTIARDSTNKAEIAMAKERGGFVMWDANGRAIVGIPVNPPVGAPPRPIPPAPPEASAPISPDLIPDFLPASASGALADQDNRLWIPRSPTSVGTATRVYDIIDRSGKLVDRVSMDVSVAIVGFGKGGNVYLFVRDGGVGRLQRVRFK